MPGLAVGVLIFLAGVYFATKSTGYVDPVAPATGFLVETRPILSPALFTGKVDRIGRVYPKYWTASSVTVIANRRNSIKPY